MNQTTRRVAGMLALALGALFVMALPAAALVPAGVPSALAAQTPGPGTTTATAVPVTLDGTIIDGTTGTATPGALSVTATEINAAATAEVATATAHEGPHDTFSVSGLPGHPGDQYVVSTDYLGVTYVAEAHPPTATVLSVYETSTDNAVISVPSETLTVLKATANQFNVIQLMRFQNNSGRTYIGTLDPSGSGYRQTVELPIPQGAANFAPGPGLNDPVSTASDNLPVASDPILPGSTDISYFYSVTVANSGWPMTRAVIYPTARAQILLAPGLTLTGPGLTFQKTVTIQGQLYRNYVEGALQPGTSLAASISLSSSSSITLWVGLGLLIVLVIGAAFAFPRLFRMMKKPAARPDDDGPPAGSAAATRADLIDEIAKLDEAHEAGEISDEDHAAQRAGLKERLVALEDPDEDPDDEAGPEPAEAETGPEPAEAEAEPEPAEPEAEPEPAGESHAEDGGPPTDPA
jgi:hypothetical protein